MIYGDNPQKINEREDALGLKTYTYVPQITAIMQAGNLYVYGVNNPNFYVDSTGELIDAKIVTGIIASAVVSGLVSGVIATTHGEKFVAGFVPTFITSLATGYAVFYATPYAPFVSAIFSAMGSGLHDWLQGGVTPEQAASNAIKALMIGGISGFGAVCWRQAIVLANAGESAANLLMNYDKALGDFLEQFFAQLRNAAITEMGYEE